METKSLGCMSLFASLLSSHARVDLLRNMRDSVFSPRLPESSNVRDSRTHPLQQQTESELPPEKLEDIIYRLELEDSIRSLAVSKSWLAAAISVRVSNKPSWHMVFPRSYMLYKFYDPSKRKSSWLESPVLEEAKHHVTLFYVRLPERSNVRDSRTHPFQKQNEFELPPEMLEDIISGLELEVRRLSANHGWLPQSIIGFLISPVAYGFPEIL
ncbi:hypothetical protein RD792_006116 [Penstemon davidsonii]|uniref:F-box domain-containing protein n=1 Tax=Penstemon davidsonii TaxID=160366 RepID=A0ABR0DDM7_9LAMI|nr:hypothetical protein RD792_006116 [Penstemon davidsonii]